MSHPRDHIVSEATAKALAEAGYDTDTLFYWLNGKIYSAPDLRHKTRCETDDFYPAPIATEIHLPSYYKDGILQITVVDTDAETLWTAYYEHMITGLIEAEPKDAPFEREVDARAHLYLEIK